MWEFIFDEIFAKCEQDFAIAIHRGSSRRELMRCVRPGTQGVYMFKRIEEQEPLYVGSSGKIIRGMIRSGSTIRSRIFNASTPYRIDGDANVLRFDPTTAEVPPDAYRAQIPLSEIEITVIEVGGMVAPSVVEGHLIQGAINQYGDLPKANQKI